MNKKFLFNLVKIANDLDGKGLIKEANVLDNVLVKIAQGNSKKDYQPDILNYKKLILDKKFKEAEEFLDKVAEQYTDIPTRDAFLSQARRIQNEQQNVNLKRETLSNDDLYKLIKKYNLEQAKDLNSFNGLWQQMTSELKQKNLLNYGVELILTSAYRNLTAKFTSPFQSDVSLNYDKDIEFYKTLITNNLAQKAQEFLNKVLQSSYDENAKAIFQKDAESIRLVFDKNNFTKEGTYHGLTDDYLNEALNYFGILQSSDIKDFESKWQNFINFFKTEKFQNEINDPNAPNIYDYPVVQRQLELTKDKIFIMKNFNNNDHNA